MLDRLRTVTLPMLGPVTMFVVMLTATRAFEVFDTVRVLTQGGPNFASDVLLHRLYTESFDFLRTGYGAALTVVYLTIVMLLTLVQARVLDRRVHLLVSASTSVPKPKSAVPRLKGLARHGALIVSAAFALVPFIWMLVCR